MSGTVSARERRKRRAEIDRTAPVWIYARISFDHEALREGVARQVRVCHDWARQHGRAVANVCVDNNLSALKRAHRPGFEVLRDGIKSGECRAVLTYHPDRLTRNTTELEGLIDLLDAHAVEVNTYAAGLYDLTSATGRMTARVVGAVATQQSEQAAERVSLKHEDLALKGLRAGGVRPYGYVDVACTAVVPHERALILDAATRVVAGESLRAIARDYNARGDERWLTMTGRQWNGSNLGHLLRRKHLKAVRTYDGLETRGTYRCPGTGCVAEAPHGGLHDVEPVIAPELWERCHAVLDLPERKHRNPVRPHLLAGLIATPHGEAIESAKSATGQPIYRSRGEGWSVPEPDLEEIVTARFLAYLERAPYAPAATDEEAQELEARAAKLNAKREELRTLQRDGLLTPVELRADLEPIQRELDAIKARTGQLEAATPALTEALHDPRRARRAWLATDEAGNPILDVRARRALLKANGVRVTVTPAVARGPRARLRNNPERVRVLINGTEV